jgi:glycosyltransferase involved in cell wall biosynthesis
MSVPSARGAERTRIGCLSSAPWNPYLRLLYGALGRAGIEVVWDARLGLGWLWRSRRTVRVLHVHWPEGLYRFHRGPRRLRRPLSWAKLPVLALRLAVARVLGYRIVWTVHQVYPHETTSRTLDRLAARVLAALCHGLIAHDEATAELARRALRRTPEVIPHGSYIGVYPPGRPARTVRQELGIADDAFVFLAFGELRRYKGVQTLLDAFAALPDERIVLVVAGNPKDGEVGAALEEAAARDPRLRLRLGFVRDEEVAELFDACAVSVLARADGGTSGSLILALSLGRAVVAADTPTYRQLTGGRAGWLFRPGDAGSLREALAAAAADPAVAEERGRSGRELADALDWERIGEQTRGLLARL